MIHPIHPRSQEEIPVEIHLLSEKSIMYHQSCSLARSFPPIIFRFLKKENPEDMKGDNEQTVKKLNAGLISQCTVDVVL